MSCLCIQIHPKITELSAFEVIYFDIGIKWWNSNKMEGLWRKAKMCWAAGIWGLVAAEVMSLGQSKRRVKNKSLSLFWSSLQSRRGGGPGSRPRQGLLGNGKGCQAGPTANIRSSHLCSQKPGVLPKASFRLHGMITLDVGQLLRACSLSPPSLSLSLYTPSLGSLSFSTAFKSFLPNMQQLPWLQRMEH